MFKGYNTIKGYCSNWEEMFLEWIETSEGNVTVVGNIFS